MKTTLFISIPALSLSVLSFGACGIPEEPVTADSTQASVASHSSALTQAAPVTSIDAAKSPLHVTSGFDANWASGLPADAIVGGAEADGTPLYICRGDYSGGVHPGKTRKDWGGSCDIGIGGREIWLTSGNQALVPAWTSASGGSIPPAAVAYGNESTGSPLYICRASYGGGVQLGKIGPGSGSCYIPYGGSEVHVTAYEVLVNPGQLGFRGVSGSGSLPAQAVVGGHEADGTELYLCLGFYNGGVHPGKTRKDWGGSCDIGWGGAERWVTSAQILVPQFNGAPLNAATRPYVGGSEPGHMLGVCNASYSGSLQLGKYVPGTGCNFGFGGTEISLSTGYQILSTFADPSPINYDTGYITFDGGVPVGGEATLRVNYDGTYVFQGHFHDSGAVCFDDSIALVLKSKSGKAFTFTRSGSMGGTFCGGSRDDNWNLSGSNPALADAWADLKAGYTVQGRASSSLDLGGLLKAVEDAIGYIETAVAIVGELV